MNTNIAPQGLFGPGIAIVTRTDIADATPVNVGFCNEFSYDLSGQTKDLEGQNQFPLLIARGSIKATGKIKAAAMSGQALNALFLGGTWDTTTQYDIYTAAGQVPSATTYEITPTLPNSGTADVDLGAVYTDTNIPLEKVASVTKQGQYSYSNGVYTFDASDASANITTSTAYSYTGGSGQTMTVTNQPIGTTPTFQLDYKTVLYGATYYIRFFNGVGTKWQMGHKINDYAMPEYDWGFFANASGQVFRVSLATQA